jgi:hypothetical protein
MCLCGSGMSLFILNISYCTVRILQKEFVCCTKFATSIYMKVHKKMKVGYICDHFLRAFITRGPSIFVMAGVPPAAAGGGMRRARPRRARPERRLPRSPLRLPRAPRARPLRRCTPPRSPPPSHRSPSRPPPQTAPRTRTRARPAYHGRWPEQRRAPRRCGSRRRRQGGPPRRPARRARPALPDRGSTQDTGRRRCREAARGRAGRSPQRRARNDIRQHHRK